MARYYWLYLALAGALVSLALLVLVGLRVQVTYGTMPPTATAGPSVLHYLCWYSPDWRRERCDWVLVPLQ